MSKLQPTEAMVEAGVSQLWEDIPGLLNQLYEQMEEDEVGDFIEDVVVFIWQAMKSKEEKE